MTSPRSPVRTAAGPAGIDTHPLGCHGGTMIHVLFGGSFPLDRTHQYLPLRITEEANDVVHETWM